ncbi:MAG: hypothetical protein WB760_08285 [Xanthobacteraceae bacterium]
MTEQRRDEMFISSIKRFQIGRNFSRAVPAQYVAWVSPVILLHSHSSLVEATRRPRSSQVPIAAITIFNSADHSTRTIFNDRLKKRKEPYYYQFSDVLAWQMRPHRA